MNEALLIIQLIVFYSMVICTYCLLGEQGMYIWTVIATISANIEVLIQVKAFNMNMTLGNILFATTFVITDILSEIYGKKSANRAVTIGIFTSIIFIIISQSWLLFNPNNLDFAMPSIKTIFSNTPRLMITGLVVYAIVQRFDVWAYHKIWKLTTRISKDKSNLLWLRNNGATLLSQLLNAVLFNIGAFYRVIPNSELISLIGVSYLIFIITSICDTPIVYICRKFKSIKEK